MDYLRQVLSIFILSILIFYMYSCNRMVPTGSAEFADFGISGFTPGHEYLFYPFEKLSVPNYSDSLYNIYIAVRYYDSCPLRSVPVVLETYSPGIDSITTLSMNLLLFDNKNFPLGKGHYGVKEQLFPIFLNMKPIEDLTISVMSPEEKSEGILAFGIVAETVGNKNRILDFNL